MNQTVRPGVQARTHGMARETSDAAPAATVAVHPPKTLRASPHTVLLMAMVGVVGALLVLWAWRLGPFDTSVEATDNSYVRGQVTALAPQVSGAVREVLVSDFQHVRGGDPLVKIDDRLYRHQLEQALGQREVAEAALRNNLQSQSQAETTIAMRRASLAQARAELQRAQAAFQRTNTLSDQGFRSAKERDDVTAAQSIAEAALSSAEANVVLAEQQAEATRVAHAGLEAQLKTAEAQVDLARLNLANTVITAPQDGQISEASVRPGQYVSAGAQLMFLIPPKRWIVANFKETQTAAMRVGQPATFTVDGLNGVEFRGRIEEIAPATGSEFSVLRADNASGNFTKVVQRIPIRISIASDQNRLNRLRPGMSVTTRIDTATAPATSTGVGKS